MVTIGVPESLVDILESRVTEEMILPLPEKGSGVVSEEAYQAIADFLNSRGDVLAAGPGLTAGKGISTLMERLLTTVTVPAVLDADALNALPGKSEVLAKAKAPLVCTPHPGEMARLLREAGGGKKDLRAREAALRTQVESDRIGTARRHRFQRFRESPRRPEFLHNTSQNRTERRSAVRPSICRSRRRCGQPQYRNI